MDFRCFERDISNFIERFEASRAGEQGQCLSFLTMGSLTHLIPVETRLHSVTSFGSKSGTHCGGRCEVHSYRQYRELYDKV